LLQAETEDSEGASAGRLNHPGSKYIDSQEASII